MNKTALQWFKDVMYPYLDKESKEYIDILFNHALQMEREQIYAAHNDGYSCGMHEEGSQFEYYKETYGGEK
jgi:hypothetical protein